VSGCLGFNPNKKEDLIEFPVATKSNPVFRQGLKLGEMVKIISVMKMEKGCLKGWQYRCVSL
jgi:hypothetical protein